MSRPRVVMTSGVFDLLHRGHLNLLWQSRHMGDLLVVGVVSDPGTRAYKGRFPQQNVYLRMRALSRLPFVSAIEYQATTDPTPLLERFRPDIMTHGDDWHELREGMDTIRRLGVEWRLIPYTPGVSTTQLRAMEAVG